jgi:tRNA1(Val) A37 N6-methylase TrmN6
LAAAPENPSPPPVTGDWIQPLRGYRFTGDSVRLARFCPEKACGHVLDLGAGSGVVALEALAAGRLKGAGAVILVERDPAFLPALEANMARARALSPGIPPVKALIADWRGLDLEALGGPAGFICSNPPYFKPGEGRLPPLLPPAEAGAWPRPARIPEAGGGGAGPCPGPDPERAGLDGRWELHGGVADLARAAARLMASEGSLRVCFPRKRLQELLEAALGAGLRCEIVRFPASPGLPLALAGFRKP